MLTLGTAGHVDHGKTALVGALTGVDTDRLAEERERGISIELGYARLELPDGTSVSVVDVPGHERFVRTMVAGATGIDLALVCVAVDDGVMPQTREHLAILAELGVTRGVMAVTKADLGDAEQRELARLDLEEALADHPLADVEVVDVSARTGEGLDALRAALARAAAGVVARTASGRARLPIDRVFSLRGIGTVATGTLWSGTLRVGDRATLVPGGREVRIRSLQMHDAPVETAAAGGRTATALVGAERTEIPRGSMLVVGPAPPTSFRLDVEAHVVPGGAVRDGARIEVLHGTAGVPARVVLLGARALAEGEQGLIQLRLDEPLAALRGDRCVLRSLAPPGTIAGARVLDPAPPRHTGDAASLALLEVLADDDPAAIVGHLAATSPLRVADVVARGLLEPDDAEAAARTLVETRAAIALGDGWLLGRARYRALGAEVRERLRARAAAVPLDPAVPVTDLLAAPGRDALVARLERDGVLVREPRGARDPEAASTSAAHAAADAVVAALAAAPFAPPALADAMAAAGVAARDVNALTALLERDGRIVRLPGGTAVARDAYDEARRLAGELVAAHGAVTIATLRDATGSNRRIVQSLLERMDADGYTRRVGDERVLRRRAARGEPGA